MFKLVFWHCNWVHFSSKQTFYFTDLSFDKLLGTITPPAQIEQRYFMWLKIINFRYCSEPEATQLWEYLLVFFLGLSCFGPNYIFTNRFLYLYRMIRGEINVWISKLSLLCLFVSVNPNISFVHAYKGNRALNFNSSGIYPQVLIKKQHPSHYTGLTTVQHVLGLQMGSNCHGKSIFT